MILLAACLAAIPFVITFVICLFVPGLSFGMRVYCASLPAGMTFLAAILLCIRDRNRNSSNLFLIRSALLARDDLTDEEFLSAFPGEDSKYAIQVRDAISKLYEVPASKIRPGDDLKSDLGFDRFELLIHHVISIVFHLNHVEPRWVRIRDGNLRRFSDLVAELRHIVEGKDVET